MTKYISEHPELSLSQEFSYRVLDDVKVKGKKQAVELIEILDQPLPQDTIQEFEEARQLYRTQKWNEAIQALKAVSQKIAKALGKSPEFEDGPCETYLERCQKFLVSPPASDWDGSWEMESK
jgi:adenylate cyclase